MKNKLVKVVVSLVCIYLLNRCTYLFYKFVKSYLYYDYDYHYFKLEISHLNYHSDLNSIITYLLPFNPYFIFGWLPIICLNIILVTFIFYSSRKKIVNNFDSIKECMFIILLLYIFAIAIFAILSMLNEYQKYVPNCDSCIFGMFLENYSPYSPALLCGFLFGNTFFAIIWSLYIRKYLLCITNN